MTENVAPGTQAGGARTREGRRAPEWVIPSIVIGTAALITWWATYDFLGDDPHITFTYSRNIADGVGFVFNHGDRTLSTTTPLMATVMAVPSAAGLDLQFIGILLSVVAASTVGGLLYVNLRHFVSAFAALLGAVVVILHPFTVATVSNEMLIYIAFALLAFHLLARDRFGLAAVCAAVTVLIRPDGALVLAIVALVMIWRVSGRGGLGYERTEPAWARLVAPITAVTAILLPWVAFATWYFGSPVPVTLRAKQAQRESGLGVGYVDMVQRRLGLYDDQLLLVAAGLLALFGLYLAIRTFFGSPSLADSGVSRPLRITRRSALLTLVLAVTWNALYAAAYIVLDVTAYGWYASPLILTIGIATAFGAGWVTAAAARAGSPAALLAASALVLMCVVPLVGKVRDVRDSPPTRLDLYPAVGEWLSVNVPPDATVGTLEVGLIGYFGHRNLIDFAGLLQPDAATEADLEEGFNAIAEEAYSRYQPDFVAMLRPGIPTIITAPDFVEHCTLTKTISRDDIVEIMDIYDCRR